MSRTITRDASWLGPTIQPGELLQEYLKPLGIGQVEAATQLGVSLNRLKELVLGKRGVTADTALRLERFLNTSPQLWMRLQADWDLQQAMVREGRKGVVNRCSCFVPDTQVLSSSGGLSASDQA
jgi:addiction module HigA family antidote